MERPAWYKQSGFRFAHGERSVYIDPWEVPDGEPPADLVLVTHAHEDHFDRETIERLRKPATVIVAPRDVARELKGTVIAVKPGERREIEGLRISVVPAYNIGKPYHPRENGWVGYVIETAEGTFYHAGDTDRIPEMEIIRTDVALLPIGGTYTMDAGEAAEAARVIGPKLAIPMHYGFIVGSRNDGERFREFSTVPVELLVPRVPFAR